MQVVSALAAAIASATPSPPVSKLPSRSSKRCGRRAPCRPPWRAGLVGVRARCFSARSEYCGPRCVLFSLLVGDDLLAFRLSWLAGAQANSPHLPPSSYSSPRSRTLRRRHPPAALTALHPRPPRPPSTPRPSPPSSRPRTAASRSSSRSRSSRISRRVRRARRCATARRVRRAGRARSWAMRSSGSKAGSTCSPRSVRLPPTCSLVLE